MTRCHHGDEPGRAGYGYERDSPRAPPGAAASRPLANGSKRTQAGPCTWPAPPSLSARFLDAISLNTPRSRARAGREPSGIRPRPVGQGGAIAIAKARSCARWMRICAAAGPVLDY